MGQDFAKTAALYKKACDGDVENGCGNLGDLYWRGAGLVQDKAKGQDLLKRACRMGSQWSCDRLKEIQKEQ